MGVDMATDGKGHDAQRKIGVITEAHVQGNELRISGYLYARDFPKDMARIDRDKHSLGFSFELTPTTASLTDVLMTVESGIFTGAAILYKRDAAYQTTSLAAAADEEQAETTTMTLEELQAAVAALTTTVGELTTKLAAAEAEVNASRAVVEKVEPHAQAVEACSAAMCAANIGEHPTDGHVHVLNRMAASMRADAAEGKVPHIFRDHDYPMNAATTAAAGEKPMDAETKKVLADLTATVAALTTSMADLKAAKRDEVTAPARKTLSPEITALLDRAGVKVTANDKGQINPGDLEAAMKEAGITDTVKRIAFKRSLERSAAGLA